MPQKIGRHLFYRDNSFYLDNSVRTLATAGRTPRSVSFLDVPRGAIGDAPSLPSRTIAYLKQLRVTVILYGPGLGDRTARLNNVVHHVGDELSPGLTLAFIGPDAVVVSYRDRLFRFSLR
jgi:hypothetical protein